MAETLISGFHLLELCGREYSETIRFSTHENEIGEGYDDSVLFGADTGNRRFSIAYQTLRTFNAEYELDGALHTPAEYLWELFVRWKVERKPVVIQSRLNNQYYLCGFIDSDFTLTKAHAALFSGQPVFRQIRRAGVTVFDPAKTAPWGYYKIETINENYGDEDPLNDTAWADSSGNSNDLGIATGGNFKANEQNSLGAVRLNGTTGFFARAESVTVYQALMVVRIYEAAWSNLGGVLTGATSGGGTNALLVGNGSGTKFYSFGLANLTYKLNGAAYAQNDMQSPMNEFGLVYVHYPSGMALDAVQIGKDRDYTDRYAKLDIGDAVIWDTPRPASVIRETAEHLLIKWGLS